jgi:high-affinity nickel-transport protein
MHTTLSIALFTAALLGFRHGFDYDHIAAITDVVSVQSSRRMAMKLGMIYALGHALMVAVLGSLVIVVGIRLPITVDHWAERLVGLTLLLLGTYILGTLVFQPANHLPKSRYMLLHEGYSRIKQVWRPRQEGGKRDAYAAPSSFSGRSVFIVGLVHGLGAETPSQLMIFLLAANLGGAVMGLAGLGMFLTGLLVMNTLMTASTAGAFGASNRRPHIRRAVFALTGLYSLVMGVLFVAGRSSWLPGLN